MLHKVGYDWVRPSLVAQMIRNLPAMQETRVWLLGWENPLERGMLPTLIFLPVEFHWQRSMMGHSPWSCKKSDMIEWLTYFLFLILCSCWSDRRCRSAARYWTTSPAQYHLTQNRQEMSARMLLGSGDTIYSLRFSSSRVINRTYALLVVLTGLLPCLLSGLYFFFFNSQYNQFPSRSIFWLDP